MPRFHFDVANGQEDVVDDDGQEFQSVDLASREARRILHDLACDEMADQPAGSIKVTLRQAGGRGVYEASVTFADRWL